MAKKKPARPTAKGKPSKPPKGTGGGGAASDGGASPDMDSGARNFSALAEAPKGPDTQAAAESLMEKARKLGITQPAVEAPPVTVAGVEKHESDFIREWNVRKKKLHAAQDALWKLPASEYENIIREVTHTAPTSWHVRMLILDAVRWLKWLSKGRGDQRLGIPENDEGVIGRVHYQLARITREFNVSLTAKSTPQWLLEAKKHPEFKKAWKEFSKTKGEHEKDEANARVIEVDTYGGQMGTLKLRCAFGKKVVRMEWRRGAAVTRQETRHRISSNGVLQHWLADVLTDFDKGLDYPGSPMSHDWAERWANEELYMKHFMPHAEREWKPDEVDELQARASGLLTTNNSLIDGTPRYDFGAFKTRIKRLALRQIRFWRDGLVPPAKKVSRK